MGEVKADEVPPVKMKIELLGSRQRRGRIHALESKLSHHNSTLASCILVHEGGHPYPRPSMNGGFDNWRWVYDDDDALGYVHMCGGPKLEHLWITK